MGEEKQKGGKTESRHLHVLERRTNAESGLFLVKVLYIIIIILLVYITISLLLFLLLFTTLFLHPKSIKCLLSAFPLFLLSIFLRNKIGRVEK